MRLRQHNFIGSININGLRLYAVVGIRHIYGGVALNGGIGTVASTGQAAPTV